MISNAPQGIVQAVLQGLHEEQVTVIIKTDGEQDASRLGPQPDHVRFTPVAPHAALFSHCDLFISDGILRNLKEALIAGTPVVVIPLSSFTDQLYCAERCAALGLGRTIAPQSCTADAICEAVRAVLADPGYRDHARHFQEEMLALPGPDYLLHLLKGLVTRCA
jgi:dTDP-L-oleandrosyltransferase